VSAPANRWKLGLFVVAGIGVASTALTWVGFRKLERATHEAWAYFDEALTGLEEGSPVKFRGVTIGVVKGIRVGPDKKHLAVQASLYDDYLVDLGLEPTTLEGDCPLPPNLRAQVVMSWVTSTAFVQVDFLPDPPAGPQQLPFPTRPNTLRTVPSTAKSLEGASRDVLRDLPAIALAAKDLIAELRTEVKAAALPSLAGRLDRVLDLVEQELRSVQQRGTVAAAGAALDAVRAAANSLRADDGPVAVTLHEVQAVLRDLRGELDRGELATTTQSLRGAADGLGTAALAVTAMSRDVQGELANLRAAVRAVERPANLLERDPAALLRGHGAPIRSPLEERNR
jgi:phospholipid/cholesterol/gamma-HCH transport system substrate-binding protein